MPHHEHKKMSHTTASRFVYKHTRCLGRRAMNTRTIPIFLGGAISLASCTYPTPDAVQVFVDTLPPGAACTLSRDGQSVGHVDATPGVALVPNQDADYLVTCKRAAYPDVSSVVHARAETRALIEYFGGKSIHSTGGASVTLTLSP
jgi:hypothetical protein